MHGAPARDPAVPPAPRYPARLTAASQLSSAATLLPGAGSGLRVVRFPVEVGEKKE